MSTFTGFSRLYANKHHIQDVLASIALSFLSSYIFVHKKNNNINYSFNYDYENNGYFLNFSIKF